MTRSFILAAVLSAMVTAAAWGQTCDEIQQLRMDKLWEQANTAFDAGKAGADQTYREEFQAAHTAYEQALGDAEAAYDGSLYWAVRSAEELGHSAIAAPIADAVAKRAEDRNEAHREWASSVSDMMSRWSASMEKAEIVRSVFVGRNVVLIEEQFSDCR